MSEFDDLAESWDEDPGRVERARAIAAGIRGRCELSAQTAVLEVGAGTGAIGRALARDAGSVVLLDPSAGMARVARRRADEDGLTRVRVVHGGLDEVAGEIYDLLIAAMVLHHMDDTGEALGRFADLLSDGGQLAIADLDTDTNGQYHGEAFAGHHGFDRDELGRALSRAGFCDLEWSSACQVTKTVADGQERVFSVFLVTARKGG
ncbi:MAG: class I SAM-dependent methyltransferase [Propionibacteriaceae bacterium]|nr:class I SAM-dependent methyltransferase [Propionibacteriaceae bacterium]